MATTTTGSGTPKKRVSAKTKAAATSAAVKGNYTDKNFDFIPDKDQLSREELAAQYQNAVGVIYGNPELKGYFEQALNEGWSPDRLKVAIQNSDWYKNNNEYARTAWAQEAAGGADWQMNLDNAKQRVMEAAQQSGAQINDQEANALARRYVYEGWGDAARKGMMMKALSEEITYVPDERGVTRMVGGAGNLSDTLKQLANANGMTYTDNWYLSAAKSVASGLSSASDWERDIREQAASMWPIYGDKIRSGANVYDLASPYINTMAQEFEIDPNSIDINDSYIRSALTGVSEKGDPAPTGLWDFQKKLRQDPRWMNTSKAQNEITSGVGGIMQMFGLMGRG